MIPKTILIAVDDTDLVAALELSCRRLGLEVITAEDAFTALSSVDCVLPDLVCMDGSMPGASGLFACEMIAGDERLASIPAIIFTEASDETAIRRCHEMNAHYVQKSGDVWQSVEPILRELLEIEESETVALTPSDRADESCSESAARRPRVLYVEDDVEASNAMKIRLESLGVEVIQAFDGTEGYRMAFTEKPDVILCDFVMPEGEGDYVLRRFRENPVTDSIPVIFLTGRQGSDLKRRLCGLGADGFLIKPIDLETLVQELSRFVKIDEPKQTETTAV